MVKLLFRKSRGAMLAHVAPAKRLHRLRLTLLLTKDANAKCVTETMKTKIPTVNGGLTFAQINAPPKAGSARLIINGMRIARYRLSGIIPIHRKGRTNNNGHIAAKIPRKAVETKDHPGCSPLRAVITADAGTNMHQTPSWSAFRDRAKLDRWPDELGSALGPDMLISPLSIMKPKVVSHNYPSPDRTNTGDDDRASTKAAYEC